MPGSLAPGSRALVTGGSGVLGRALTRSLHDRGVNVRVLDQVTPPTSARGVEFVRGDVVYNESVFEACRDCSVVFHLAGRMPQARLSAEGFRAVNVDGTRNVADGCIRCRVPTLVFASTIEIYGPQRCFPVGEDSPRRFTGIYSRNKWECEQLLRAYRARRGLRVSMLRMPLILGAGFYHETSVIQMMRRVRLNRPLPLPGGPEVPFTALAATDAAAAFLAAAEQEAGDGEAFNITAGPGEPTRALFRRFIDAVGSRSRIVPVPRWIVAGAIAVAVKVNRPLPRLDTPVELLPFALTGGDYDITKAARVLGYAPRTDCLNALVETYRDLVRRAAI